MESAKVREPVVSAKEAGRNSLTRYARQIIGFTLVTAGLANRDDARFALGLTFAMQQNAINCLQIIIHRLERELPTFPRAEIESNLAVCKKQRERMIELAVSGGFIQAR